MSNKTEELLQEVVTKLDHILKVVSLQVIAERSMTEAAHMLKTVGLDTRTVAELLNTTPATIRVLVARRKG